VNAERPARIRQNASCAATRFEHPQVGRVVLRRLRPGDAEVFGRYLEGLGAESRRRFAPHPHTMAEARRICGEPATSGALRFLVLREADGEAAGYFILYPGARPAEIKRYAEYGIPLDSKSDCTFAPSVADAWQGKGLGSAVMTILLGMVRELGFGRVVLSGGTQATNRRAIRYYEKFGFRKVGSFQTESKDSGRLDNHDMMMILPKA
jgi:RimJ/RimL family protein N-acetyltransferase